MSEILPFLIKLNIKLIRIPIIITKIKSKRDNTKIDEISVSQPKGNVLPPKNTSNKR